MKLTYNNYREILNLALEKDYSILSCVQYYNKNFNEGEKIIVLRHDVDNFPERALEMAKIENDLGIRSTYFFRSTSNYYNILSYNCFSIINEIDKMGHEIGYHAEPVDFGKAMGITYDRAFSIGKKSLDLVLDKKIQSVAAHREATGNNNLYEYLCELDYKKHGILYEAYDDKLNLFNNSTYNTDSYEFFWRNFYNGELSSDKLNLKEIIERGDSKIYSLTHPNLWYERYFHE